ncbi:hypothetical protein D3C72_1381880 [compost metagenome]
MGGHAGGDQLGGFAGVAPTVDRDRLALLQILVAGEEVLDLLDQDGGQLTVAGNLGVVGVQLVDRHGQDLLVAAGFVDHLQHADGARADDAARHHRGRVQHDDVAGVAVVRQGVRHEAVVARIVHGGVQEAVDEQGAGFLVHLVLHRQAALRDLDDDVDVPRRIRADRNGFDVHVTLLLQVRTGSLGRVISFASPNSKLQGGLSAAFALAP